MREPLKCWTKKKIPVVNISLYAFSGPIYTITDAVALRKPSSLEPVFFFCSSFRRSSANGTKALSPPPRKRCCVNGVSLLSYHVEVVFSVLATGPDQSCGAGGFPPRMPWRWWVFNLSHPRGAGPATLQPNHWIYEWIYLKNKWFFSGFIILDSFPCVVVISWVFLSLVG